MHTEEYDGLISPDAYEYLDNTPREDFLHDEMLEEQEEMEDFSFFDDEDEEDQAVQEPEDDIPWEEDEDDSHLYAYSSLFDEIDNEEEASVRARSVPASEAEAEVLEGESPYADIYEEEEEEQQKSSSLFEHILSLIPQDAQCSSYLISCSQDQRDRISEAVSNAVRAWSSDKRDKMFTIPGGSVTVAVVSPSQDPMTKMQRLQSVAAVMQANGKASWTGLFLFPDNAGNIASAQAETVTPSAFTVWQWRIVQLLADRISKKRT